MLALMTRTMALSVVAASLLVAAGFGCGDDDERRPSQMLAGWQGPPPRLQISVTGPDADDDKREKCSRMAREAGILVDPMAPVQGILTLGGGGNRLQIMANGAVVRDDQKPGWDMEHLCNDALMALLSVARQTPGGAPPPGYGAPPPGYGAPPPAYGGPPMVTIILVGPAANDDKRERCNAILTRNGGTTDPNAAVRAILNLADGGNSLQVVSARRGIVLNQPKPGWGMEQLCNDAFQNAQMVLQQEMSAPPPPAGYQPPPQGYAPPQGAPQGTVAVSPMPASPGAPKNVTELANKGLNSFSGRDYAGALSSFQEATKSGNDPAMLFDTGLCFYMLHRPQESLQQIQLYVDRAPQAQNRPQADALIADLQRQMGMAE
jgi:hypothetical protein